MFRLLTAVLACLLLTSCVTDPAKDVDLGEVVAKVRARMNEMGTATYRTDSTWGSIATVLEGVWRRDADGVSATMAVRKTKPVDRPMLDVVLAPGSLYWRTAGSDAWMVAPESDPEAYFSPLGGFALSSDVGAELDYLEGQGTKVTSTGAERLDGVDTTRYVVEVDPAVFAASQADPFRRKLLGDLAGMHRAVVATVWVDASGLPVKATAVLPFDERRESTTRFADWGKPVDVVVPLL